MNTSSEHLPKRAKTAALRQVQVCFHSAMSLRGGDFLRHIERKRNLRSRIEKRLQTERVRDKIYALHFLCGKRLIYVRKFKRKERRRRKEKS